MAECSYNPRLDPAMAGRARRFVIQSVDVVHARIDKATQDGLGYLKRAFAGPLPADAISTSMIFRRAMMLYQNHLFAIQDNPQQLQAERDLLTKNTRLPRTKKVKVGSPTLTPDR